MGVFLELLVVTGSCRLLQKMNGLRIIEVLFFSTAALVVSNTVKSDICTQFQRIKCFIMKHLYLVLNVLNIQSADPGNGSRKVGIN